ncbi:hypothetical protein Tco_0948801 [Tanacetum coccineum]
MTFIITAKYGAPNETWNGDQIDLVADDVVKTFFGKSNSKQDVPECSMIEANVPECSTKMATKDVASPIAATMIVDPQTEVIEISSGIEELESSSTSELESSSTVEEVEDDKDDSDDETWSPNKKGATSSSSPSTKKKLINRGEPVRHCIIGLANPRSWDMIVKKEFRVRKEEVKKQVNESKEQVNKGEVICVEPSFKRQFYDRYKALHDRIQAIPDGGDAASKSCRGTLLTPAHLKEYRCRIKELQKRLP